MKKPAPSVLWACAVMTVLFLTAAIFRPLMPVDETRYMTVAWEMYLKKGWFAPLTLNFEPYSHKPPMLLWLINLFWAVFGLNRWAALIPIILAQLTAVFLTVNLGKKILPPESDNADRATWLMLGSIPLLIYGTLMMFDVLLTVFVLSALITLVTYAEKRQFRYILLMSLFTGLGLLTKGPVAYLYVIFPFLLAPYWVGDFTKRTVWYTHLLLWLLLSLIPVSLWLIPVLSQSDDHFAFWLLWEQTAGRVTGNFNAAHVRPFYFYLELLPVVFLPWLFFPAFWKSLKTIDKNNQTMRFLGCWLFPVFVTFCLISGKQAHYMIPLVPGIILFLVIQMKSVSLNTLRHIALGLISACVIGQIVAHYLYFPAYDLQPVATYVEEHKDGNWAYVKNYHGEIGFMAHLDKPIDDLDDISQLDEWFSKHPQGHAVVRYNDREDMTKYNEIYAAPYRGWHMGVFSKK